MRDAALRRFDAVLVWKLDRLGRSVRNCLDGIEALRAHGVRFLAVSQSIDTDEANPTARLLQHILASVAEFERELIRERVRAGIKSAKHRGKQLGRKRIVFDRSRAEAMQQDVPPFARSQERCSLAEGRFNVSWPKNVPTLPLSKLLEISSTMARESLAHIKKFVGASRTGAVHRVLVARV